MKSGNESGEGTVQNPLFIAAGNRPFLVSVSSVQDRHLQPEGGLFMSPLALPVPRLSVTSQDKDWVKEDTMSARLRDTTEPSAWFRRLFSLGVLPPPRSQGKLLWVRAATSGRRISCARVPQRRSLSAANLHPSLLCELLGSEVASITDVFLRCGFA